MHKFPHLKFSENLVGRARFRGYGKIHPTSLSNKKNRLSYSRQLLAKTIRLNTEWTRHISERQKMNLAPLKEDIVPVFLQINPDLLENVNFDLQAFGIEIISEEENGFIVGASSDNLRTLQEKINQFASSQHGGGKIADFWQIIIGDRNVWKPKHILTPSLMKKWDQIKDSELYNIEVSIAFDKPIGKEPDITKRGGIARLEKYREKLLEREDLLEERQSGFIEFIEFYKAELLSSFIELEDSFGCHITISGKGLKDLVLNYPYVFEISEIEKIAGVIDPENEGLDYSFEVLSPVSNAPEIAVIDSGIMENHKFLEKSIKPYNSKSYLENDPSVMDKVRGGGHGTKVAGAILYPNGISGISTPYQLPCFIRNLRILNKDNTLEHEFPAELMQRIVYDNSDCRIFNLSVSSTTPYRKKHMSLWAATLDKLIYENNILFITTVGNIPVNIIQHYIRNNYSYPDYLLKPYCRLANPAQSSFSIAVGSINHMSLDNEDWNSLGKEHEIAPYSRIGTGIWGHIKPDVVEFGGGMKVSKNGINTISQKDTAIELLRCTFYGGSSFNKESVGTSFATPKVSYIVMELLKLYSGEHVNLIRALLVQGARLPNEYFFKPTRLSIQHFGYGVPSLQRVTENTEHRVTFYNTNQIQAEAGQIYSLKIPEELRDPGNEYDILIEVTLAYTAKVRRTRQKTKSYMSTWLEWKSSNLNENYIQFRNRSLSELEGVKIDSSSKNGGEIIPWKIRERNDWGQVEEINRNRSSLQKDWAIIKSFDLPDELHFAILAHKGWDLNKEEVPYAITVSIEILGEDIPIYDSIKIENEAQIQIEV
ncbi:peptidase [Elizabethkingia anophelis]|nr:peptidase [Elizabethkingia anophelis]MDV3563654.1 peptidase [Elizabethkingia anophelis]MDV3624939.1 peptidase [Elizabethkingia anophelis]MDV3640726.1 peptidase [Elizabethkingia anophelis]MDV3657862.1 peptidase [Elizabethkingia anophelis]